MEKIVNLYKSIVGTKLYQNQRMFSNPSKFKEDLYKGGYVF